MVYHHDPCVAGRDILIILLSFHHDPCVAVTDILIIFSSNHLRERCKKKIEEKKLTIVSFMYVCVAENGEMLVFFSFFFPTIV